ncbi:hypothetical protein FTUN_2448 [Frigoriglobus tundricola]|uniref:Uncharacterized protein n=1 Tax=Frigoriglobus tundricola TaxID=2774151 RepID=A0A6M5YPM4_9BACT|nr:hypothetical protein FTUN_2448 [Frigoriglobus tundricola]
MASASRAKRAQLSGSGTVAKVFTATVRCRSRSRAWYTTPIPPRPSSPPISYPGMTGGPASGAPGRSAGRVASPHPVPPSAGRRPELGRVLGEPEQKLLDPRRRAVTVAQSEFRAEQVQDHVRFVQHGEAGGVLLDPRRLARPEAELQVDVNQFDEQLRRARRRRVEERGHVGARARAPRPLEAPDHRFARGPRGSADGRFWSHPSAPMAAPPEAPSAGRPTRSDAARGLTRPRPVSAPGASGCARGGGARTAPPGPGAR